MTGGDIIYYLLRPPVRWYLKQLFNIRVENNPLQDLQEPYLLLGHHVTSFDPIISNAYSNRLIRFIAGDANQDSMLKKVLLGLLESIPFAKNRGDAKSIRELVRHTKAGRPVGLYPEGGRNWDGTTDYLIPSTAKLIKLLKVPVYATFFKGGYLSRPRWASNPRKGTMVLDIQLLLDRETVREKSAEELYRLLVEKLSYNEYNWQKQQRILFRGRNLAEHIERLLYLCPACAAVNTMASQGNTFHCTACQKEYEVDQYGEILGCPEFSDTVSWNRWQQSQLPQIIQAGFEFANSGVKLQKHDATTKARSKELVDLVLSSPRLELVGKKGKEFLALRDISSLSITFKDVVEFYLGKVKYRLTFDPRRHMSVKLFYDILMQGSAAK
jgi:1-acyl-sn-glycerol-3-phosphate acyltransferase